MPKNKSKTLTGAVLTGFFTCLMLSEVQAGEVCFQLNNSRPNHAIKGTFNQTILSPLAQNLALSVNDPDINPALSGNTRIIKIKNEGFIPAYNVQVSTSGFPAGTEITSNTCTGMLNANDTCNINTTPGGAVSLDNDNHACTKGREPTPAIVTVFAENTTPITVNVWVLGYGCIYQGGYLFSVDDTTPDTCSIGGKVAALSDQATASPDGIIWSIGTGRRDYESIPGIDETSTKAIPSPALPAFNPLNFVGCNGATDGFCNVKNIFKQYLNILANDYAAGLCSMTLNGFNDWYLPAICEMGYGSRACGDSEAPTLQNIHSNLVDNKNVGNLVGYYWSSTEYSIGPKRFAWYQFFLSGSISLQLYAGKASRSGVRCIRALTA